MAAKKSRTSKKSAHASEGVTVQLDSDTILTLKAAAEAISEFASAMIMASDDPTVRGSVKASKKRAGKSAKKKA